jgi:hypothetical protein
MEPQASQETQQQPSQPQVQIVRDEDFTNLYANNMQSEMSVWDLKVIFGILDQSSQPNKIVQHTAINLPWAQVKLASYFLQVAVVLHEAQNVKISIPALLRPPDPATIQTPEAAALPTEAKEKLAKIYKDFLASL